MTYHRILLPLLLVAVSVSAVAVPPARAAGLLYATSQGTLPVTNTFTIQVKVAGMDSFNNWDIHVSANPAVISATGFTITPNTLTANFTITELELSHCVNGMGTGCDSSDGPGVVHSATFPLGAAPPVNGINGVIFTITYTVVGTGSSTIHIFNDVLGNGTPLAVIHTTMDGAYGAVGAVVDFSIAASPATLNVVAGTSGASLITLSGIGGFTGSVSLAASASPPTGVNVTVATPVSLTGGSGSTTLSIFSSTSTNPGLYIITVTGTATINGLPVSHSTTVQITVTTITPDFEVDIAPNILVAEASYSTSTTVIVKSLNGFVGDVTLSNVVSPIVANHPVATYSANTVSLTAGATVNVTMKVQTFTLTRVPAPSGSGLYAIIVIGTSGTIQHSNLAVVAVQPAVFFLHLRWTHHLVFSKTSGVQTFVARVQNNATDSVVVQVILKARCVGCGIRLTTSSTGNGVVLPGGNVTANVAGPIVDITFSLTLPAASIGDEFLVRAVMLYGGSSDPTTLTCLTLPKPLLKVCTNIVNPLVAVTGKVKTGPTARLIFNFTHELTGKFFVLP